MTEDCFGIKRISVLLKWDYQLHSLHLKTCVNWQNFNAFIELHVSYGSI